MIHGSSCVQPCYGPSMSTLPTSMNLGWFCMSILEPWKISKNIHESYVISHEFKSFETATECKVVLLLISMLAKTKRHGSNLTMLLRFSYLVFFRISIECFTYCADMKKAANILQSDRFRQYWLFGECQDR